MIYFEYVLYYGKMYWWMTWVQPGIFVVNCGYDIQNMNRN